MATQVQKNVLRWMAAAGGEIVICTGFKKTRQATLRDSGAPCIATSSQVVGGLTNNRYVEPAKPEQYGRAIAYRLTDAGRAAADLRAS